MLIKHRSYQLSIQAILNTNRTVLFRVPSDINLYDLLEAIGARLNVDLENYQVYYKDDPLHLVILKTDEDLELALEQLECTVYQVQSRQTSRLIMNGNVPHLIMRLFVHPL